MRSWDRARCPALLHLQNIEEAQHRRALNSPNSKRQPPAVFGSLLGAGVVKVMPELVGRFDPGGSTGIWSLDDAGGQRVREDRPHCDAEARVAEQLLLENYLVDASLREPRWGHVDCPEGWPFFGSAVGKEIGERRLRLDERLRLAEQLLRRLRLRRLQNWEVLCLEDIE